MKIYGAKKCPTRDFLERVIKTEYGISPLPELEWTEQGKPFFPALPHIQFSISHSKSLILCALSDRPVGVDIEDIRPRRDSLPAYALTKPEFAQYQDWGGDWSAFYALWTRKEAWCKYTAQGLKALWGQTPPEDLHYGTYAGEGWKAAVCGEEEPPAEILWLEGGPL
ncbi:MAG: 4'-phosphopantetheinyl transferase superfamily protein [Ruminiclostridium sp.]|nr:4'-phosphopantetheinyl transferase superfamily protein [Ruminiclostridium sp.]